TCGKSATESRQAREQLAGRRGSGKHVKVTLLAAAQVERLHAEPDVLDRAREHQRVMVPRKRFPVAFGLAADFRNDALDELAASQPRDAAANQNRRRAR